MVCRTHDENLVILGCSHSSFLEGRGVEIVDVLARCLVRLQFQLFLLDVSGGHGESKETEVRAAKTHTMSWAGFCIVCSHNVSTMSLHIRFLFRHCVCSASVRELARECGCPLRLEECFKPTLALSMVLSSASIAFGSTPLVDSRSCSI